jgi:hypothetical protein
MADAVDDLSRTRRLRALLAERRQNDLTLFASASEEAVAEARSIGRELATLAVSTMLASYEGGRENTTHERAADLAHRLHLVGAVPALVGCLERLSEYDSVAHAVLRALEPMGKQATGPLLEAFGRCTTPYDRLRLASALRSVGGKGDRVRDAYLSMLADDPGHAAGFLAEHHDRTALPHLSATLDRLELPAPGDFDEELRLLEEIVSVAQAIRALRGAFTLAQREKVERAWERSEDLLGGPSGGAKPMLPLQRA